MGAIYGLLLVLPLSANTLKWCLDNGVHFKLGAMLRREGIYYSTPPKWRESWDRGVFEALENKKPGPEASEPQPSEWRVAELERENQCPRDELNKAKVIIDVQKKFPSCWVSALRTTFVKVVGALAPISVQSPIIGHL